MCYIVDRPVNTTALLAWQIVRVCGLPYPLQR